MPLVVQFHELEAYFPGSKGRVKKGMLEWSFDGFRAFGHSGLYRLEISARTGRRPIVWLSGGSISDACIADAPHKYGIDKERLRINLCLEKGDWKANRLFVDTYVPWAMEWIAYFEIWIATGEWTGGGVHPRVRPRNKRKVSNLSSKHVTKAMREMP